MLWADLGSAGGSGFRFTLWLPARDHAAVWKYAGNVVDGNLRPIAVQQNVLPVLQAVGQILLKKMGGFRRITGAVTSSMAK